MPLNFTPPNRPDLAGIEIRSTSVNLNASGIVGNCVQLGCARPLLQRRLHFGIVPFDLDAWSYSGRLQFLLNNAIMSEIVVAETFPLSSAVTYQGNIRLPVRFVSVASSANYQDGLANNAYGSNGMDFTFAEPTAGKIIAVTVPGYDFRASIDGVQLCIDRLTQTPSAAKTGFFRACLGIASWNV